MSRLKVFPIVEGHGEVVAVLILLRQIWHELLGGEYIEVLRPWREKRDGLVTNKDDILARVAQLGAQRLSELPPDPELILILFDADNDAPCQVGPATLGIAQQARSDKLIACVVANVEYETWFVAAAESLGDYLNLAKKGRDRVDEPETRRSGKKWIQKRFKASAYNPRLDLPRLTAKMDLQLCRRRSPSFDKLCRELEKRLDG